MTVYLYKQYYDRYAYGEEYIEVFFNEEDALKKLKQDVESFTNKKWEDIEIDEETDTLEPDYVAFDDGNGTNYFMIEEKEVIK